MNKMPLTKDQVKSACKIRKLRLIYPNGDNFLCQKKGYSVVDVFDAMDQGAEVFEEGVIERKEPKPRWKKFNC